MPPHFGECRWWLGLLAIVHVPQIARSIWHSGRSGNPSHVVDPLLCFKCRFTPTRAPQTTGTSSDPARAVVLFCTTSITAVHAVACCAVVLATWPCTGSLKFVSVERLESRGSTELNFLSVHDIFVSSRPIQQTARNFVHTIQYRVSVTVAAYCCALCLSP